MTKSDYRILFHQYLGPYWAVQGLWVNGKALLYAIHLGEYISIDPDTGYPMHGRAIPEKVLRAILHLSRELPTQNNRIQNFSTWLFKWDSKDHAYEISTGDWDPRDL